MRVGLKWCPGVWMVCFGAQTPASCQEHGHRVARAGGRLLACISAPHQALQAHHVARLLQLGVEAVLAFATLFKAWALARRQAERLLDLNAAGPAAALVCLLIVVAGWVYAVLGIRLATCEGGFRAAEQGEQRVGADCRVPENMCA